MNRLLLATAVFVGVASSSAFAGGMLNPTNTNGQFGVNADGFAVGGADGGHTFANSDVTNLAEGGIKSTPRGPSGYVRGFGSASEIAGAHGRGFSGTAVMAGTSVGGFLNLSAPKGR